MRESPPGRRGSLGRGSMARLLAEVTGAFFGLVTGVVTARYLGPEAKGTLSSLTFLVALAVPVCALGIGEAAQSLLGRASSQLEATVNATLAFLLGSTGLGALLFLGLVRTQFGSELPGLRVAIAAAALSLPLITLVTVLGMLLDSSGDVVFVSGIRASITAGTAAATVVMVPLLERAITGAVLAIVVGWSAGLLVMLLRLRRLGHRVRPRWDAQFMRRALPIGGPVAVSSLIIVASTRVDLLFVRALAGREEAGQYAVALTVGQLATYPAVALSAASFPVVAAATVVEARVLVRRLCRTAAAAGVVAAALLAVLVPLLIPLAFGELFAPAVGPSLILLAGGVLWGVLWSACRAESARGRPRALVLSYGVTLGVIAIGDLLLIPVLGLTGAALASVLGSAAGLVIVTRWATGDEQITPRLLQMAPRGGDLLQLMGDSASVLKRLR